MATRRRSIVNALAEKFKEINGTNGYVTNLYECSYPILKFWDEINSFPSVYMSPGSETREYHPADFAWGFLGISVKAYVKGEDAQEQLEYLLADLERCIDQNRTLIYDSETGYETTEILIQSITTDEGLLAPYGVGEINLEVRYQIM